MNTYVLKTKELLKMINNKFNNHDKLYKQDRGAIQSIKLIIKTLKNQYHFNNTQINKFLNKLPMRLKKSNHNFYNLNNNKGISIQGTGKISKLRRPRWLSIGEEINGQCLTTKMTESPRKAKESILSNILLEDVPQQYYIDGNKLQKILKQ